MAQMVVTNIVGLEDKENNDKDLWGVNAFIKVDKEELNNLIAKLDKGVLELEFKEKDIVLKKL